MRTGLAGSPGSVPTSGEAMKPRRKMKWVFRTSGWSEGKRYWIKIFIVMSVACLREVWQRTEEKRRADTSVACVGEVW
jgi:hypothetical protein